MSLTKLFLSLVSDIPAGDGKINNLFYSVRMANLQTHLKVISYNCSGGGETFPGRAGAHRHGDYSGPRQLSRSLANRSLPFLTPTNQRLHLYSQLEASPPAPRTPVYSSAEPVLLNVYGAPELIPRNEFRQPM